MVTAQLSFPPLTSFQCNKTERFFSLSSSSFLPSSVSFSHPPLSCSSISHDASLSSLLPIKPNRLFRLFAVAEGEPVAIPAAVEEKKSEDSVSPPKVKPCQLYVCNLPRSSDMSQLIDLFKPYGDVQTVEISRNADTGISRGCGYVTMASIDEAIAAMTVLDGFDVGGRDMRVKFSEDMNKKANIEILNPTTNKSLIFETPHKIYVGNLAWSTKPESLREHFTQFGKVVSVRVLYDRKDGKNRVYAFLSFSSDQELKAAMSSDKTELLGRKIVIRNALKNSESK